MIIRIAILSLASLVFGQAAAWALEPTPPSATWPQWRGPGGMGAAQGDRLPATWPAGQLEPLWEAEVGIGWSSPIVAEGRVFITDRIDGTEQVIALDANSGKELWKAKNAVDFDPHPVGQRHGNGPKSTPLVRDGRVYSLGIAGWLQCVEANSGKVIWKVNLPETFGAHEPLPGGRAFVNGEADVIVPVGGGEGAPVPLFGYTGSLAFEGDKLIVPVGGVGGGTIMAFHKDTGKVLWKSLEENVSYSSPVIATLAGVRQVVVMTGPRVVGLDLADGKLLWSYPFQVTHDESIGTPVISDDLVIFTATGRPLTALRVARRGDALACDEAWTNEDVSSYLSSMLVHAGHVYGMNDGGEFACVRLTDGKTLWLDGRHGYYCTPVLAGTRLLGLNERGTLMVLAAEPQGFRELAQSRLMTRATWTSPAVVGSRIYLRGDRQVRCFELAK